MVAGYIAIDGVLKQSLDAMDPRVYWAVFGFMLFLTPLYVCFRPMETIVLKCSMRFKAITATFAFAAWVFALGGPFAVTFPWYKPVFGSIVLILTTLTIPVIEKIGEKISPNPKLKNKN